ncbi:MAG: exodeoxyribonuclease VII large subunit [Kurthia sp.]|nr:exodeoxyribonuclease VII large subunit [Candidatus Kurthia equi]
MSINYLTVQALTKYIKRKFEADPYLREVYVKGELSNVKVHGTGHIFFTLKDEHAQIQAIMYASNAKALPFRPESGMKVLIRGDINLYESAGRYQLYANDMQPDGVGSLHVAYEQLKKELSEKGFFNERFKQPIVKFPNKIGVITALTGAAIQDILSTLQRHYPIAEVVVIPTLVQGKNAAPAIVSAIERANRYGNIDTLIVGRGGGSIEDLWAFNEEIVATAIFESRIPIISAVGHETDTTIADFVADLRAPTPTGAAKMAVPDKFELLQHIHSLKTRLFQQMQAQIKHERARLTRVQNAYPLAYPERLYRPFIDQLLLLDDKLRYTIEQNVKVKQQHLNQLTERLQTLSPMKDLQFEKKSLANQQYRMQNAVQQIVQQQQKRFQATLRTLEVLNPLAIMSRGYSIVYDEQQIVTSIQQVEQGQQLKLKLSDGQAVVKVVATEKMEEEA